MKGLAGASINEDEKMLIERASDKVKAAATITQRTCYPIIDLVDWHTRGTQLKIKIESLMVDATVARAVSVSGSSKVLEIIKKTQAVDLLNLRDNLAALGMRCQHVGTHDNLADLWTKAVPAATLEKLKDLIGREAGHEALFA